MSDPSPIEIVAAEAERLGWTTLDPVSFLLGYTIGREPDVIRGDPEKLRAKVRMLAPGKPDGG